ncbi:glycosyltransferase [Candidatus Sumerlaeota bacterium]|nr:glycosyltransferase [Candidatus Sumerlaeota bacterium]
MEIAFDIQPFEGPDAQRGIGRYTFNLLKALLSLPECPHITLLGRAKHPPSMVLPLLKNQSCSYTPLPLEYPPEEYLRHSPLCPFDSNEFTRFDIIHITSPLMPDTLIPCWAPCSIVATLYDLIPLILKEDSDINVLPDHLWRQYMKRVKTITSYDKVLCISEQTADDLSQKLQVPSEQIEIIMAGVDDIFFTPINEKQVRQIIGKWGLTPGGYVFTIGGFNPRKNMDSHFLAFARLLEKNPAKKLKLVVTCRLSHTEKSVWQEKLKELGIEKYVILTNEVSDRELQALYHGASAFLFLSLYEGFGLPVAEACVCSLPVVASAIPTNMEILGENYPYLVEPYDAEQSANYLKFIVESPPSPQISEVFSRVRQKFRWQAVAERCLEIYQRLCSALPAQRATPALSVSKKPRVAIVSPLSSIRSGIADYIRELLPHLVGESDVLLFSDEPFPACSSIVQSDKPESPVNSYPARLLHRFVKNNSIDLINYHIGNNITHSYAYFNLRYFPGIITLHDLVIAPFIFELSRDISPLIIRRELEGLHSEATAQTLFQEFLSRWHLDHSVPLLR